VSSSGAFELKKNFTKA